MAWLNRRTWESLGIGLVGLFVWGGAAWGQPLLFALPPSKLTPADTSEGSVNFSCHDLHTLAPVNCTVTAKLDPLDPATTTPPFFGGHVAHTARQKVGTVRDGNAPGAGGESVTGETLNGFTVVYTAPEASGQVQFTTTWTPPPSYVFVDGSTFIYRFDVGFPLQDLNLVDPFFGVIRGDTNRHPNGTSGTANTLKRLKDLAALYYSMTGQVQRLSINDISLPQGGLFDVDRNADWSPPHRFHRRGTEVDLNRAPLDQNGNPLTPIDCLQDVTLREVVEWLAVDTGLPELVCESGGRKHIKF
jgi:hypothetical protein